MHLRNCNATTKKEYLDIFAAEMSSCGGVLLVARTAKAVESHFRNHHSGRPYKKDIWRDVLTLVGCAEGEPFQSAEIYLGGGSVMREATTGEVSQ
jgi:hypothetical protein